jgi:hypothetical protein
VIWCGLNYQFSLCKRPVKTGHSGKAGESGRKAESRNMFERRSLFVLDDSSLMEPNAYCPHTEGVRVGASRLPKKGEMSCYERQAGPYS